MCRSKFQPSIHQVNIICLLVNVPFWHSKDPAYEHQVCPVLQSTSENLTIPCLLDCVLGRCGRMFRYYLYHVLIRYLQNTTPILNTVKLPVGFMQISTYWIFHHQLCVGQNGAPDTLQVISGGKSIWSVTPVKGTWVRILLSRSMEPECCLNLNIFHCASTISS